MTDARYPERWLNDRRLLRLSDRAHRTFVMTLAWSVSNRTDGVITDDDLDLIPRIDRGSAAELVTSGLWTRETDHWLIIEYATTQTTSRELEALDKARRAEREKKRRQRARKAGDSCPPGQSPGTSGGTTQDRTGQARTGELQDHPDNSEQQHGFTCPCSDCETEREYYLDVEPAQ